ncbi:MAG: VWA domain-containing protein [Candidatus Sulfotelmatobacter sp.]
MRQEEPNRSVASIIEFCNFARTNGLSVGVQQTLAAIEAAKTTGIADRQAFAFALRTVMSSSKEEWDLFNQLFEMFWSAPQRRSGLAAGEAKEAQVSINKPKASSRMLNSQSSSEASSPEGEGNAVSGASAQHRLQKVDFSDAGHDDLVMLEQISLRLFRKMGLRLSRRLKIRNLADRVDMRRTIRRSIPHGGDPIVLAFQGRKPRKHRLVIFLDISGSMNSYSLFLVRFAYALQKYFKRVDTFLFSTDVVEITDVLRTRDLPDALRGLSQRAAGWAGGTKIGESLRDFNRQQGRKLLSRNTVFIILSDGWDTGEPEMLAAELRITRRHIQKLIWLNPLLGLKDYEPVTRGMSAALPYVDVFAAAHNLESLLALERYL